MMRIKDVERWLAQSLASVLPLVDGIVILDDGSTDRTPEICRACPEVVRYQYQVEPTRDEYRDKNRLLRWALEFSPDWIMVLDGDEVLEERAPSVIQARIAAISREAPDSVALEARFLYFWRDPAWYVDEESWHPLLFTTWGQDVSSLQFDYDVPWARLHCGRVPSNLRGSKNKIDVYVKHYGYQTFRDCWRKYRFYVRHDPVRAREGYYDHLLRRRFKVRRWVERSLQDGTQTFEMGGRQSPLGPVTWQSRVAAAIPPRYLRPLRIAKYLVWG